MDENSSAPVPPYRIGLDVGGTKIEGIVLDGQGREFVRLRRATPVAGGYGAVVESIAQHYRELAACIGDAPHTLGMGTPGSISPSTALLRNCNATVLNGQPLQADLEVRIGRALRMANDANCFVLAEARLGAARQFQDVLGLVLGTGVGAGLVVGGQVVAGRNGIAGEWGHMVLDPSGPPCYCGRRGCVERYLSGPSLAHAYGGCAGHSIDAQGVVRLARAGNPGAAATLDRFLDLDALGRCELLYVTALSAQAEAELAASLGRLGPAPAMLAINPGMRQLQACAPALDHLLALADMVSVNEAEARQWACHLGLQLPADAAQQAEAWMGRLRRHEGQVLVVTLGERGALLHDGRRVHFSPARRVAVRSTLGAGDAFAATMACCWAEGRPAAAGLEDAQAHCAKVLQIAAANLARAAPP